MAIVVSLLVCVLWPPEGSITETDGYRAVAAYTLL